MGCTPDRVKILHRIAKEACEAVHERVELLRVKSSEELVQDKAVQLVKIIGQYLNLFEKSVSGEAVSAKEMKEILGVLEALDKNRKRKITAHDTVD